MFLKSLDIFGFKSFADRTHIQFADGITALLGPNGCGKSNVVDAVKWVLGEQAAKTMRAEKMEDIIFNGTDTRKPLNVAEVTLTISNENNLLPLEYPEVTIRRRLYRSGESEYYINGTLTKLKNVRELFWDTGVGKAAYSVMEQGKIDQILSSKPEDRRYLFEEAAGITRFKVKRADAERKLQHTQENMIQIENILNEVRHSYETLKVQSDKTFQYRSLKEAIFNYELDIQLLRLRNFTDDKKRREEELLKLTDKRSLLKKEIDEINEALSSHMDEVNTMQEQVVSMQKELFGLAVEKNEKDKQGKAMQERAGEIKLKIDAIESRKKGIEDKIEILREESDEMETELYSLNKRATEISENIKQFESNIKESSSQIDVNEEKIASYEDEILKLNADYESLQKELESLTENIVRELDAKLKDKGYSSVSRKNISEKTFTHLNQIKIFIEGRKNLFADFEKIKNPSSKDVETFSSNAVNAFAQLNEKVLELENDFNEYESSIPDFIDEFLSPEGIITKKRSIDEKIQKNSLLVKEKKEQIESLKAENSLLKNKIDEYKKTLEELRLSQMQVKTQAESSEKQLSVLKRELSSQETSLKDVEDELYSENYRLKDVEERIEEMQEELASIEYKGKKLSEQLSEIENEIASKNSTLTNKRDVLKEKNEQINKLQVNFEKLQLDLATSETEIRNLNENFRDLHSRDLSEFTDRMQEISKTPAEMRDELAKARQELKDLGSVNLMAPEEFAEVKERYDFLSSQMDDLKKAYDDLNIITEEIKAESTEMFVKTYREIKKNFHNMFRRLFGGGRAELRLIDSQNVLETGIDIFAQPPGKKLENIALLSGGEKTMTAVALLFATYMVRPSPFCLLDEIDAALDEQNVLRFVQTLRDFANVSQYIVITHNKKTVTGAGSMLGVTMQESGVTKVVSIKLENSLDGLTTLPDMEPFEEEDVEMDEDVYMIPHPKELNRNNENI